MAAARPVYEAAGSHSWLGKYETKGLGVFGFGEHRVTRGRTDDDPAEMVPSFCQPIVVEGPQPLQILAVWVQGVGLSNYVAALHDAIARWKPFVERAPTIVAGDCNSAARFDKEVGKRNHTAWVRRMEEELGLVSAYHTHFGEEQGAETRGTFFRYRRPAEPFHLDHVFVPRAWRDRVNSVEVGTPTAISRDLHADRPCGASTKFLTVRREARVAHSRQAGGRRIQYPGLLRACATATTTTVWSSTWKKIT